MQRYSVDRIEDNFAVLEKDCATYIVALDKFEFPVEEGMIVIKDESGKFTQDMQETAKIRKKHLEKQNRLFSD